MPTRWNAKPLLNELDAKVQRGMERAAIFLTREIKIQLRTGQPPGPPGKPPHRLTGALARSIDYEMSHHTARIGTNLVYGRIHELGGDITAKKAKALRFKTADGKWHTVKKVRIPKRPYLRPSLDNRSNRRKIQELVARG
jgi:phage gpG-like protein